MPPGRSRSPVRRQSQSTNSSEKEENVRILRPRQSNVTENNARRSLRQNLPSRSLSSQINNRNQDTSLNSAASSFIDVSTYIEMTNMKELENKGAVLEMDARDFTIEYARKTGLKKPLLFTGQLDELGMKIPNFDHNQLLKELPPGQKAKIFNHHSNEEKVLSISTVVQEFRKPQDSHRRGPLSFSFECSDTEIAKHIQPPSVVQSLDWSKTIFPKKEFANRELSHTEKYLTMSMAGAFADFHIEFTGTTSWLHLTTGHHFVFLIPPTTANMLRVENWHTLTDQEQEESFIEYWVPNCTRIRMDPGNTLLIPSGWINAIYSPVDCILYGGNFLHEYSLEMQMRICESDQRIRDRSEYTYPCYEQTLWYFVADFVRKATGREYVRLIHSNDYDRFCALKPIKRRHLCYDIELEKPEFYDQLSGDPVQKTFDAIDSGPNDPPSRFTHPETRKLYANGYDDYFLKQIKPELRANLKRLARIFNEHLQNGFLIAEGIRRPKHLCRDFERIIEHLLGLPYIAIVAKNKKEPSFSQSRAESETSLNTRAVASTSTQYAHGPSDYIEFPGENDVSLPQNLEPEPAPDTKCDSFRRRLLKLQNRGHYDCVIRVGDTDFKVFKNVLMCQSKVFEETLAFDGEVTKIHFENISVEATKAFIEWMYMGRTNKFEEFVEQLFGLSVVYKIRKLKFECVQQMTSTINDSTICRYLILAFMHPDDDFKKRVIEYARRVPKLPFFLLKDDCWKEFSHRNHELSNTILDTILVDNS